MAVRRKGITNETLRRLASGKIKDNAITQTFVNWIAAYIPDYQSKLDSKFPAAPDIFQSALPLTARSPSDMRGFDALLAKKDKNAAERLRAIRKRADIDLARIPISDYAHASVDHAVQATEFIAFLFQKAIDLELTAHENFILGVLTYVHDVGMLPLSADHAPKYMYSIHAKRSQLYVENLATEGLLSETEASEAGILCKYHNRPLEEALGAFEVAQAQGRLPIIFSMFRIADMLDVELQPGEMLRIHPEILRQTIADVIPAPDLRRITIQKAADAPKARFRAWTQYFSMRMKGFNAVLSEIGASYDVQFAE